MRAAAGTAVRSTIAGGVLSSTTEAPGGTAPVGSAPLPVTPVSQITQLPAIAVAGAPAMAAGRSNRQSA